MITEAQLFSLKDILELVYFVTGGPVLAIVAGFALFQIKVSKEQIRITSKRESIKLAAEQCELYLKDIIPLQDKLNNLLETKKIDLKKNILEIKNDKVIGELNHEVLKEIFINKDMECIGLIVSVANKMESFSTYFTSEIADSEIAFNTVGDTFLDSCKQYFCLFYSDINSDEISYYKNMMKLFINWHDKFENENRMKLIKKLEEEKNNLQKKETDLKNKKIKKSIGTY